MSQLARIYNKIIIIIYRIQAICIEFILLWVNNLQVTKTHDYLKNNHISNKGLNSHLLQYFNTLIMTGVFEPRKHITICRLVGTSEITRLILILVFFLKSLIIYNYWATHSPSYECSWVYLILFLLYNIIILYFNLSYLNLNSNRYTAQSLSRR